MRPDGNSAHSVHPAKKESSAVEHNSGTDLGRHAARLQLQPLLLASPEAARVCGVCERTWRRLNRSGLIPRPLSIGRRRLWSRADLENWAACGAPSREAWERRARGGAS